jgi:GNAT superfamily N-acetyltransferase
VSLTIRRLDPKDNRTKFRSGNIDLDRFLVRYAGQNQFRHRIGTTYVAVDRGDDIIGYATVAASELTTASLPEAKRKRLPAYPIPVLRLARLAVSADAQGLGVGQALLRAVFELAFRMAAEVGCFGVVVDAKPEAIGFYQKLGYIRLTVMAGQLGDRPQPVPMFLELDAIPKSSGV